MWPIDKFRHVTARGESSISAFVEIHELGVVPGEPFQIRLAEQRRRRSPDLFFVSAARRKLLQKHHFEGGPDLIVETVSPESQARDWREKYLEYEAAGVREYWVIDPCSQRMEAYALTSKRGYVRLDETDGRIASKVLSGRHIRPAWLWRTPLPKVRTILGEFDSKR